jgi:hypothetical protein
MTPEKIRVKLVSEAAEYVTVSHVVQRDFTLRELVEVMLPVVGADSARIRQIIRVGTVSTGDYRYRWEGMEIPPEELESLLGSFPRAEPMRSFDPARCFLVRFRRDRETLDLPRESASRKPLFGKQSFWDKLVEFGADKVRYADYDHAAKADRYSLTLNAGAWENLRGLLPLLKPKSAADRLERLRPETVELLTRR